MSENPIDRLIDTLAARIVDNVTHETIKVILEQFEDKFQPTEAQVNDMHDQMNLVGKSMIPVATSYDSENPHEALSMILAGVCIALINQYMGVDETVSKANEEFESVVKSDPDFEKHIKKEGK